MAKKKLTQAKAKEMLHNPPHGKPLTEKQRKFFGAIAGGAKPYTAQNGIEGTMDGLTNIGFNYNGAWGGPSMQFGGSLPGATGMMYARTINPAPSNGPYAKKTKASAQNGSVVKDDMGYWNPENWGKVVEIDSNYITMRGVDQPLIGISDTGDVQYMQPGEDYEFDGESVTEYPMARRGISINEADAHPLKKLDDLLNFTNYNDMAKAKGGKKLSKAQIGTYMSNAATPTYKPLDIRGMYDEIDYNLTGSTDAERRQLSALAQYKQPQPSNKGGMNLENLKQMGQMLSEADVAKKGKKIKKAQVGESTGPQLTPTTQNLQQQQMNWGQNFANQPTPNQSWGTSKQKVNWAEGIPIVGNIVKGIQKINEERDQLRGARQMNELVDVQALAASSRSKQLPRHQYVRPEDIPFQPNQLFPSYGVGTNPLAKDGGKFTRAQSGFETFMTEQGGTDIVNTLEQIPGLSDGGGDLGAGLGEAVGSFIPIPGAKQAAKLVGRALGSALDQKAEKIKAAQERTSKSISNMVGQTTGLNIQNQFQSYMQNGGYAQIGTSVGADCVKKGTCKAEEVREKGYSAIEKASRAADIAGARMAALEAKQIKQQNRADHADYINERLTGYGDKLKQKEFDADYQAFAAKNPELAKDRLLYTLANKELPKLRSNKEYYLRNVLDRANPQLGYDTLSLPGLMQAMQKGYGDSRGYLEAWNSGFRQQQNGGETSPYEWVSHTWQPQVITKFGEYTMSDLLKPPQDADMLRAGGHLKSYTPPSPEAMSTERPQFAMGGDINVHWGGYVAPTAQNPFLPGDGIQKEGFGQSHDESDGKGNTGIGIDFHGNKVEIERKEPIVKLRDGGTGDENLTVFGNINITKGLSSLLDNPRIDKKDVAGMKFKTAMSLIGKKTNQQNKIIENATDKINSLNVQSSFDKLALSTEQMRILGANQKLMKYADQTEDLAALQDAINTTQERDLLKITDKGKVVAKNGANVPKAQYGTVVGRRARGARSLGTPVPQEYLSLPAQSDVHDELAYSNPIFSYGAPGLLPYQMVADNPPVLQESPVTQAPAPGRATPRQVATTSTRDDYQSRYGLSPWKGNRTGLGLATASELTTREWDQVADALGFKGRGNEEFQKFLLENPKSKPLIERRHQTLYGKSPFIDSKLGAGWEGVAELVRPKTGDTDRTLKPFPTTAPAVISPSATPSKTVSPIASKQGFDWMTAFNQLLPYLRPSDVEQLDPNQLMGELYALSQNQVEPVYAQKFIPELATPHDISLQDIMNANQADYNATQRLTGYNPAALASLNAQKYQANQKVLGEQFRLNQAEKERVYEGNRALLNQAKLQNLNILDQQYTRQSEALSKTKATTQAALNSIASKYAQNKLDNRKLAVYENMYNYRYDPKFRLQNYQVAQFNTEAGGSALGGIPQAPEGYRYETILKKNNSENSRNGSVVKALKNI